MKFMGFAVVLACLMLGLGCQPPPRDPDPKGPGGSRPESTQPFDARLLDPLVLSERPDGALSIEEVRANGKHDQQVVIRGTVPPPSVYLIKQSMTEIKLADKEFLESETCKAEFKDGHSLT